MIPNDPGYFYCPYIPITVTEPMFLPFETSAGVAYYSCKHRNFYIDSKIAGHVPRTIRTIDESVTNRYLGSLPSRIEL